MKIRLGRWEAFLICRIVGRIVGTGSIRTFYDEITDACYDFIKINSTDLIWPVEPKAMHLWDETSKSPFFDFVHKSPLKTEICQESSQLEFDLTLEEINLLQVALRAYFSITYWDHGSNFIVSLFVCLCSAIISHEEDILSASDVFSDPLKLP